MTSRATIGECAINSVPVCTNQGFEHFIPYESTDVEFWFYLLQTQNQKHINLCGGSAFLDPAKEGHATFAEHIAHVRETRRQQAAQRRHDASPDAEAVCATRPGKSLPVPIATAEAAQRLLLSRSDAVRCETVWHHLPDGVSVSLPDDPTVERTLFIVAGQGTVTVGPDSRPTQHGYVAFVPRGQIASLRADGAALTALSFGTVCVRA